MDAILYLFLINFRLSIQIYLKQLLDLGSDNTSPINYMRSKSNFVLISNEASSIVYNAIDNTIISNYNTFLSNINRKIRSSSYPGFYYTSDSNFVFSFYTSGPYNVTCNGYYSSSGPPYTGNTYLVKQYNSTTYSYVHLYIPTQGVSVAYLGLLNCEDGTTVTNSPQGDDDVYHLVLFVPYNAANISLLRIDDNINNVRTYKDETLSTYEETGLTALQQNIKYGDTVALESGGFLFCFNSTDFITDILCQTIIFEELTLFLAGSVQSILTCPNNRGEYFNMIYLGNNRVVLSCGINPIYIQIVDKELNCLSNPIIIEDSSFLNFEITVLATNQLFIGGTLISMESGFYFKGDIIKIAINDENYDSIDNYNNYYGFYFQEGSSSYVKCSQNCLSCNEINNKENCLQCNKTNNYYPKRDAIDTCIERNLNPDRYQFDSNLEAFTYCSNNWYRDTSSNQVYCVDTCPDGLYLDRLINNECVDDCSNSDYYKLNSTRECVLQCEAPFPYHSSQMCYDTCSLYISEDLECVDHCPLYYYLHNKTCTNLCEGDYPYLMKDYCVAQCNDAFPLYSLTNCVDKCTGEYPYLYGDQCVSKCPADKPLDMDMICVEQCSATMPYLYNSKTCVSECPEQTPYLYDGSTCVAECPREVYKVVDNVCTQPIIITEEEEIVIDVPIEEVFEFIDISSFVDEGKNLVGDDFVLQIFPLNSPLEEKNNISSIDLGECENVLKREYNIPPEDTLLVSKMDIQDPNAIIPKVEYVVYSSDGVKLDMKYCEGNDITLSYPITNAAAVNLAQGESIAELGYDIYDPSDPFYNDKCASFSNGTVDVVIKDRKNDFYVDAPFCGDQCVYGGINYTTGKVSCNCSANENDVKEQPSFDSFGNQLFDQTNLMLFLCYKQATSPKNLKDNIGFYFCGSLFIVQIICMISFMITGLKGVYLKYKTVLDGFYYKEIEYQLTTKNIDIDNCRFIDAKRNEERNIFKFFFFLFMKQIELIRIFCFPSEYEIFSISLSVFLFSVASDYTMNALLFSDDIISERYDNQGSLSPVTTYTLTILSNVLGSIITMITVKLTTFSGSLELFAKEHMKEKEYIEHLKVIIKIIKIKLVLFLGYEFVMMTVYLYFLSAFCAVYKASQWNWFTNGITSNVISVLTALGITIVISILRFLGISCNSERLYNMSLYLNSNN